MQDGHRLLAYKLLMGYVWAYKECGGARYVGKTDDNVELELERLEEIGLEGYDREEYDEAVVEEILEEEDVCPVCLEKVEQDKEVLKCGHEFHQLCIEEWLRHQTSCPTCRSFAILTQEYPDLN